MRSLSGRSVQRVLLAFCKRRKFEWFAGLQYLLGLRLCLESTSFLASSELVEDASAHALQTRCSHRVPSQYSAQP